MKKLLIIIGSVVLLLIAGILISQQLKYNSLEKNLKDYLINNQGYSESDILSIKAKTSKMPKYPVYVRFADNPEIIYIFTDRGIGEWIQLDPQHPKKIENEHN